MRYQTRDADNNYLHDFIPVLETACHWSDVIVLKLQPWESILFQSA